MGGGGGETPVWQYSVVGWGLVIPGNLSIIGSSLIVYSVLGPGRKEKLKKPHMRLLLGMSLWDIIYSFAMGYTFLMAPSGGQFPGTLGNEITCRVHGFLQQLSHNTIGYSALLSIYYWLTVTRNLSKDTWERWEPFMHILLPTYVVTLGAMCLHYRLYNQTFSICWVSTDPPGCQTGPGTPDCAFPRQPDVMHVVAKIEMSDMFFSIGIVTISNFLIWRKVYKQEKIVRRRARAIEEEYGGREEQKKSYAMSFSGEVSSGRFSGSSMDLRRSSVARRDRQRTRRDRQVLIQSFLYAGCFFLTWIGPICHHIFVGSPPFLVMCMVAVFVPLQGFFNAFIYGEYQYEARERAALFARLE